MATRDDYKPSPYNPWARDRVSNELYTVKSGFMSRSDLYPWINSDSSVFYPKAGRYRRTMDVWNPVYGVQVAINRTKVRDGFSPFDIGHPFWSERVEMTRPTFREPSVRRGASHSYRVAAGYLYPSIDAYGAANSLGSKVHTLADSQGVSFSDMLVYGAAGIKRATPGVPPVSLFQILGELREGLPRIPGSALFDWKGIARNIRTDPSKVSSLFGGKSLRGKLSASGSEYLNVAFGILPTVQSVLDLIDIAQNYPSLAAEFERTMNHRTRRQVTLRNENTEDITVSRSRPYPMIDVSQPEGNLEVKTSTNTKVWVATAWSQRPAWLALQSWLAGMPVWIKQLGLIPNPANLWELVPFSWLVDYFTNAGVVLTNLSYGGVAGLGMDYAYCMAEKTVTTRWTWSGPYFGSNITTSVTRYVKTKQRIRATPFGFGLSPAALTPQQLAILAALGISRRSL